MPPPVLLAFAFVWGAVWGSFLNVVIVRWPGSIVSPGSRCTSCGASIRAYDNIPILSYLLLRGRCRACKARFSGRYAVVELLTASLSVALVQLTIVGGLGPLGARVGTYVSLFAFTCALVAISFIDLERRLIPDVISIPGTLVGLLFAAVLPRPGLAQAALGAAGGYLLVWLVFNRGWQALRGRPGMMMGDAKLLAMVGAFLGWKGALFSLLCGSVLGSIAGVVTAVRARKEGGGSGPGVMLTQVPFGPFLALGALTHVFFGARVIAWYLSLGEVVS
ncbi:MAG: prepilin peptidase [Deltaproteobacteria bacterium]|nr:prepilin peptidase [Deltaproteobacteria bacterium]